MTKMNSCSNNKCISACLLFPRMKIIYASLTISCAEQKLSELVFTQDFQSEYYRYIEKETQGTSWGQSNKFSHSLKVVY